MKKRFLKSFVALLVLVMLFACNLSAAAKSVGNVFDTVVVVDSSGSMSGEASDLKSSAISFCTDILDANPNNRIAIINFSSNAIVACGFSSDLTEITTAINNIYISGGTDMYEGCELAKNMIDQSNAAVKNLIIMTDGYPNEGTRSDIGRYTTQFPGLGSDTYYANSIIDYVVTNFHNNNINVYSVGYYDFDPNDANLSENEKFIIQFIKDLANSGSFFPADAASMFQEVGNQILENNNGVSNGGGSGIMIGIACGFVVIAGGVITLVIVLATRKPKPPVVPIMTPMVLPIADDDDEEEVHRPAPINRAPEGIDRFAQDVAGTGVNPVVMAPVVFSDSDSVRKGVIKGLTGTYRNSSIEINDGQTICIGRDAKDCHIVITNDYLKVSREHCTIKYNASRNTYTVTDKSKNGTFTKHRKLENNVPVRLPAGSEIQLADSANIFRLG